MIYFTIMGYHDQHISNQRPFETAGAAFTIFNQYKDDLDKVFIFTTTTFENTEPPNLAAAQLTRKIMIQEKKDIDVQIINFDFTPSPIDYDVVYNEMLSTLSSIIESHNIEKDKKIINISSGTPTMTACWLLLKHSNFLKKTTLVQSFSKDIQRKRGIATEEVNFKIPNFPQVKNNEPKEYENVSLKSKNSKLSDQLKHQDLQDQFPGFVGKSVALKKVKENIISFSNINTTLILGEPGTGKELVAHALHRQSTRKEKPFLIANLAGKESQLIESELFGHKKGAYTDAIKDRDGLFKSANKGTLFIDEIGDMPKSTQAKLLRAIENKEIKPVGSDLIEKVDVAIIGATNQNLEKFRQDFLSRFTGLIQIPPLRERKEDIKDLIYYFGGQELRLSDECIEEFEKRDWRAGNVRELRAKVEIALARKQDTPLEWSDIPSTPASLIDKSDDDVFLPPLPLPISLPDYMSAIINKARSQSTTHVEVDRLLKQKNVEKARIARERKNNKK